MQVERSDWLTNYAFTDVRYGVHPQSLRQSLTPFQGTPIRHPQRPGHHQNPTPSQIIPPHHGQQVHAPQHAPQPSPQHPKESTNAPLWPATPTYSDDLDAGCPGPNQNPTPPQSTPPHHGQQPYAPQHSPHHRRESMNPLYSPQPLPTLTIRMLDASPGFYVFVEDDSSSVRSFLVLVRTLIDQIIVLCSII